MDRIYPQLIAQLSENTHDYVWALFLALLARCQRLSAGESRNVTFPRGPFLQFPVVTQVLPKLGFSRYVENCCYRNRQWPPMRGTLSEKVMMAISKYHDNVSCFRLHRCVSPFLLATSSRHYALNSYVRNIKCILFRGLLETKISLQRAMIMRCG